MKVLVTGGTGFVGAWTAKAVQSAGHQVRFLVRTPAKLATTVGTLDVDTSDHVVGDVTDQASVGAALAGCQAVVHCAAVVAIGSGTAERMTHTNLIGAQNVLGEAVRSGVDRAVHVSSIAAVFRPGLSRLTGNLPVMGGLDDYGASKAEVEEYVRSLQAEEAPVDITYPGLVLGPPAGDQLGEATDGVVQALRLRVIPGRHAAWTICDVRDLGRAHAALLRRGPGPGRWAAGGVRVGARELTRLLSRASGRRLVHVPVPDELLRGVGRAQDRLGLHTPLSAAAMEYYTRMPESDNEPLARELGVVFRDPYLTLRDSVSGLRALGII